MSRFAVPERAPRPAAPRPGPFTQPSFALFMALLVMLLLLGVLSLATGASVGQTAPAWMDPSPHQVHFVDVAPGVRLEVLDWGGTGRDVVLLAGSGHSAHVYDEFALKLKDCCHVYGITRRGYGTSGTPASGYSERRLAQDVVQVVDALGIRGAVIVGHSMAGEELTRIGIDHADHASGLVYLDAAADLTDFPASSPAYQDLFRALPARMQGPPPPASSDMESPTAFNAWRVRHHEMAFPKPTYGTPLSRARRARCCDSRRAGRFTRRSGPAR